MTEQRQPTIVREDIHIVQHWQKNEYGDTLVTVAEQKEPIKIGKKRANIAENLRADTQYNFKYANYMNRDYVVEIEPVESSEVEEIFPQDEPKKDTSIHKVDTSSSPAIGMWSKEIGDMYRAGKLSEIFGVDTAIELVTWYRSQALGITKVKFDGMKLPNFGRLKDAKKE